MTSRDGRAQDSRPLAGAAAPVVAAMLLLANPVFARQAERAILELQVNEVSYGEVLVVFEGGRIWLPVGALAAAGLGDLGGSRARFDDRDFVDLTSLGPDLRTVFDDVALTLRVTVDPRRLPRTDLTIEGARPPGIEYSSTPAAFVNYAAAWRSGAGADLFAEGGVSIGRGLLEVQATRLAADGRLRRGRTSLNIDDRTALRRWTVGDLVVPGGALRTGTMIGGVGVAREYSLDPYYEPYPSPAFSGMVSTPSTVEVYVNGQMVRRHALPPGPFDVRQLPLTTGLGDTRVTVRDAYGRVTEFGAPYYLSSGLLKRRAHEYRYVLGAQRSVDTTQAADYGPLAWVAASRYGLTDWLTIGGEADGNRTTATAGPVAAVRLWRLGDLEWASAVSRDRGRAGHASHLAYSFVTRTASVTVVARVRSSGFATPTSPALGRTTLEAGGSLSMPLSARGSLTFRHVTADLLQSTGVAYVRQTDTSLTTAWRIAPRVDVHASTGWASPGGPIQRYRLSTGLTVLMGTRTSAGVRHDKATGRPSATVVDLQRSIPTGPGFGYVLRGQAGAPDLGHARLEYQNRVGRYELVRDLGPGSPSLSATASGALAAVGRRLHAARAVTQGYALVQVPGAAAVRVYANNQEVGRTDRRGDLIVPDLLSHYGNQLRIAPEDVPFDRAIERTEATIAPPFRGAARARFLSPRVRAVWGVLALAGEVGASAVPAYAEFTVAIGGQMRVSPVGAGGEFYFENLPAGTHVGTVVAGGQVFACAFEVPESSVSLVDLGGVACRPQSPERIP